MPRHLDVGEHGADIPVRLQQANGFVGVCRLQHGKAAVLEVLGRDVAQKELVLDHEN